MIRTILFFFVLIFVTACRLDEGISPTSVSGENHATSYLESLDPDTRVALAKKRKSYISGIRKGDYYSLRNNPEEALSYYLQVAEKIPNDQVVRKKIAHVYFLQKNWKSAYENYVQVPVAELTTDEQNEMLQSLFFDEAQLDRIGEVIKIPMGTGSREYYRVVDVCYTGIHNCIVTIEGYSGTSDMIHILQTTITGSTLITPDFHYRNLAVAAKFYEQGMYGASSQIAEEILSNRPDYLEAIKILGFSYYELGKYQEAKQYLLTYLEKNPKDLETTVRMGEIYAHLDDLVSSNLSLNNAILGWYTPKTDLERRLAYNYSLLEDTPWLMKVMSYLLQEEDVKEDDYAVGISTALAEWDLMRAKNWAQDGIRKFKSSSMLTPLYIEALRLSWDRETAQLVIDSNRDSQWLLENPNFLLQKAILLFEKAQYTEAKDIFEDLASMEDWPEVAEESQAYLTSIDSLESGSGGIF